MTHTLSVTAEQCPTATEPSATLAILVSSTSIKVGTTTASATSHGLNSRRLVVTARADVAGRASLTVRLPAERTAQRLGPPPEEISRRSDPSAQILNPPSA